MCSKASFSLVFFDPDLPEFGWVGAQAIELDHFGQSLLDQPSAFFVVVFVLSADQESLLEGGLAILTEEDVNRLLPLRSPCLPSTITPSADARNTIAASCLAAFPCQVLRKRYESLPVSMMWA